MNRVSVVIATLGGESLFSTIDKLNSGTLIPGEILVCIPSSEYKHSTFLFEDDNIKVIPTPIRGQVAQRAYGFRRAQYEYVLQLDDDMFVDQYCLQRLVDAIEIHGTTASVSPALINEQTGRSVYEKPKGPKFLWNIYFWLMNGSKGYQPGTIDMAGSAIGVGPAFVVSRFVEVEWLAGGCILHRRNNLIIKDFWERPGKAYFEDVLHSYLLRQRNIRLFIDTSARCELEVVWKKRMTFRDFLVDSYRDFSARKYYMKRVSKVSLRIYFYYIVRFSSYIWGSLSSRRLGF